VQVAEAQRSGIKKRSALRMEGCLLRCDACVQP
jgi:hypothetical protein